MESRGAVKRRTRAHIARHACKSLRRRLRQRPSCSTPAYLSGELLSHLAQLHLRWAHSQPTQVFPLPPACPCTTGPTRCLPPPQRASRTTRSSVSSTTTRIPMGTCATQGLARCAQLPITWPLCPVLPTRVPRMRPGNHPCFLCAISFSHSLAVAAHPLPVHWPPPPPPRAPPARHSAAPGAPV